MTGKGRILYRCYNWQECTNPHKVDGDLNYCITGSKPKAVKRPKPAPLNSEAARALKALKVNQTQVQFPDLSKSINDFTDVLTELGQSVRRAADLLSKFQGKQLPDHTEYVVNIDIASVPRRVKHGDVWYDPASDAHYQFDGDTVGYQRIHSLSTYPMSYGWPLLVAPIPLGHTTAKAESFLLPAINNWMLRNQMCGCLPVIDMKTIQTCERDLYPVWDKSGNLRGEESQLGSVDVMANPVRWNTTPLNFYTWVDPQSGRTIQCTKEQYDKFVEDEEKRQRRLREKLSFDPTTIKITIDDDSIRDAFARAEEQLGNSMIERYRYNNRFWNV